MAPAKTSVGGILRLEPCNLADAVQREDVCNNVTDCVIEGIVGLFAPLLSHFWLLEASGRGAGRLLVAKGAIPPGEWGNRSDKPPPANGAGRVRRGRDNAAGGRVWPTPGTMIFERLGGRETGDRTRLER
jgi:hypothetical protein